MFRFLGFQVSGVSLKTGRRQDNFMFAGPGQELFQKPGGNNKRIFGFGV